MGRLVARIILIPLILSMAAAAHAAPGSTRNLRVVIDPGHGGENLGTPGYHGIHEKHITLSIGLKLMKLLQNQDGIDLFMTRTDDVFVDLKARADMAGGVDADIFLSIHCNASESRDAHGVETFYWGTSGHDPEADEVARRENASEYLVESVDADPMVAAILSDVQHNGILTEAAELAATVQKALVSGLSGVSDRRVRQSNFAVLRHAPMAAVVVEVGFLSNPREGMKLLTDEYQDRIARALGKAVMSFGRR